MGKCLHLRLARLRLEQSSEVRRQCLSRAWFRTSNRENSVRIHKTDVVSRFPGYEPDRNSRTSVWVLLGASLSCFSQPPAPDQAAHSHKYQRYLAVNTWTVSPNCCISLTQPPTNKSDVSIRGYITTKHSVMSRDQTQTRTT